MAGYFERWLLKWPDVHSLAAATIDEVSWALLMLSVHWRDLQQALQTEHVCCCSLMLTSYSWSCSGLLAVPGLISERIS